MGDEGAWSEERPSHRCSAGRHAARRKRHTAASGGGHLHSPHGGYDGASLEIHPGSAGMSALALSGHRIAMSAGSPPPGAKLDRQIERHAQQTLAEGRDIFRFDTFGDEAFWGDTLRLHEAIKGKALGGVGAGVSPKTALEVGLKVDADALPAKLVGDLKHGRVNLDDPAVTVELLRLNAVIGVTGFSTRVAI